MMLQWYEINDNRLMQQKHSIDSKIFQPKFNDLSEKERPWTDEELYPESGEDLTCWEKVKRGTAKLINRTRDYFEFDRIFEVQGDHKIDLKRCQKRFLQNYDETYSEREMKFAYTFDYVLHEKIKEEEIKEKFFCNELYRFICCEGGNEMVEIDEAYKSDMEYEVLIKKKIMERKKEYEEEKRLEEEKKMKETQGKLQGQNKQVIQRESIEVNEVQGNLFYFQEDYDVVQVNKVTQGHTGQSINPQKVEVRKGSHQTTDLYDQQNNFIEQKNSGRRIKKRKEKDGAKPLTYSKTKTSEQHLNEPQDVEIISKQNQIARPKGTSSQTGIKFNKIQTGITKNPSQQSELQFIGFNEINSTNHTKKTIYDSSASVGGSHSNNLVFNQNANFFKQKGTTDNNGNFFIGSSQPIQKNDKNQDVNLSPTTKKKRKVVRQQQQEVKKEEYQPSNTKQTDGIESLKKTLEEKRDYDKNVELQKLPQLKGQEIPQLKGKQILYTSPKIENSIAQNLKEGVDTSNNKTLEKRRDYIDKNVEPQKLPQRKGQQIRQTSPVLDGNIVTSSTKITFDQDEGYNDNAEKNYKASSKSKKNKRAHETSESANHVIDIPQENPVNIGKTQTIPSRPLQEQEIDANFGLTQDVKRVKKLRKEQKLNKPNTKVEDEEFMEVNLKTINIEESNPNNVKVNPKKINGEKINSNNDWSPENEVKSIPIEEQEMPAAKKKRRAKRQIKNSIEEDNDEVVIQDITKNNVANSNLSLHLSNNLAESMNQPQGEEEQAVKVIKKKRNKKQLKRDASEQVFDEVVLDGLDYYEEKNVRKKNIQKDGNENLDVEEQESPAGEVKAEKKRKKAKVKKQQAEENFDEIIDLDL